METGKQKLAETIAPADIAALVRDKYEGDRDADISEDLLRLASGEPLAYVIGWIPFLDLKIFLDSDVRPLIPRPETEWWTEKLIAHLKYKFEDQPFTLLDLCAGSGAIGVAVLSAFPNATVSFGEIETALEPLIRKNLIKNNIIPTRATISIGDLFDPFALERFDFIVSNPPYIPDERILEESVTDHEPHHALFSGADGLDLIRKIAKQSPKRLTKDGEVWIECDISNIGAAQYLLPNAETEIHMDQYGRARLLTAHFE